MNLIILAIASYIALSSANIALPRNVEIANYQVNNYVYPADCDRMIEFEEQRELNRVNRIPDEPLRDYIYGIPRIVRRNEESIVRDDVVPDVIERQVPFVPTPEKFLTPPIYDFNGEFYKRDIPLPLYNRFIREMDDSIVRNRELMMDFPYLRFNRLNRFDRLRRLDRFDKFIPIYNREL